MDWLTHQRKWQNCTACALHKCREKVVFCRGKLPCDVLFIGEAPGRSEDSLGAPFVGPAGHLLDEIIGRACLAPTLQLAFTNLVCCIPLDEPGGKIIPPPDWAVRACAPRLAEFVTIAAPRLIVCVGDEARDWLDPKANVVKLAARGRMVSIVHPAAIQRANIAQQGLMKQRAVVTLMAAVESLDATNS